MLRETAAVPQALPAPARGRRTGEALRFELSFSRMVANEAASTALAALGEAMRARDLASAVACFARDACIRTPDATVMHGRERVGQVLAQLLAMPLTIKATVHTLATSGDVAIGEGTWLVSSFAGLDGRLQQTHRTTFVFRRLEGVWKIAIAFPWG